MDETNGIISIGGRVLLTDTVAEPGLHPVPMTVDLDLCIISVQLISQ
jgi:hypothetical protein